MNAPLNHADIERQLFSARLRHVLESRGYDGHSPTKLQREFTARYDGPPVTIHAVRKWLVGESIPTQGKIKALAEWLGVEASYLRFGEGDAPAATDREKLAPENVRLLSDLAQLSERDCRMIRTLASLMVREKAEKAA